MRHHEYDDRIKKLGETGWGDAELVKGYVQTVAAQLERINQLIDNILHKGGKKEPTVNEVQDTSSQTGAC